MVTYANGWAPSEPTVSMLLTVHCDNGTSGVPFS